MFSKKRLDLKCVHKSTKLDFSPILGILASGIKRIRCFAKLLWSSFFGNILTGPSIKTRTSHGENKSPWMSMNIHKCRGGNFIISLIWHTFFQFDLKKTFLLKLTNEKYLKIPIKIHSTETQTLRILWLKICSYWKRLIPLN